MLTVAVIDTRLGWIGLSATSVGIRRIAIALPSAEQALDRVTSGILEFMPDGSSLMDLVERLVNYLAGYQVLFPCTLDLRGATLFQNSVWEITKRIPYGETRSYAWVAKQLRNPGAVRAVGRALSVNPFPILVPCHRVIGADGTIGGYNAGLDVKQRLLEIENNSARSPLFRLEGV